MKVLFFLLLVIMAVKIMPFSKYLQKKNSVYRINLIYKFRVFNQLLNKYNSRLKMTQHGYNKTRILFIILHHNTNTDLQYRSHILEYLYLHCRPFSEFGRILYSSETTHFENKHKHYNKKSFFKCTAFKVITQKVRSKFFCIKSHNLLSFKY